MVSRFGVKTSRLAKLTTIVIAVFACVESVAAESQRSRDCGLPVIRIDTKNGAPIVDRENYVNMTFKLTDCNKSGNNITVVNSIDGIRGRGNTTWWQPKKPYRIKFDKKQSLFGLPAAKSWILLAEYFDPTLLKNTVAFELGDRLGLRYNHTYHHVDLYLNGEYKGVYVLTEQNQVGKGRVDIDEDYGWLVELDFHYDEEPKFKTTSYELPVMIKSPEVEPENIGNPAYDFVRKDINELCDSMASVNFPENGYRDLIDMDNFIQYIMIPVIVGYSDFFHPNTGSTYIYKDRGGKISGGPIWDFDRAFGYSDNTPYLINSPTGSYCSPMHLAFFPSWSSLLWQRFFQDPVFFAKWIEFWNSKYFEISSIPSFIDSIAGKIRIGAKENFKIWWAEYVDFDEQVERMKEYYNIRIAYLNEEYNKINVLPQSKTFTTQIFGHTKIAAQKFTLVSYGDMTDLSASLRNAEQSDFEISAELNKTPAGNGGYLAAINVKPKDSLPIGAYTDTLVFSGNNQEKPFLFMVPLSFRVKGETPAEIVFPVFGESVVYSPTQKLSDIALNGSGDGVFLWENGGAVPVVNVGAYNVMFIPNDTVKYDSSKIQLSKYVELRIEKAVPAVIWPERIMAMAGQTLEAVPLASFTNRGGPAGVFLWTTPKEPVGEAGIRRHSVTFTPADNANYSTLTDSIMVDVLKGKFTVGPNPVARQYGILRIYREGRPVVSCELRIYNALGNIINTVKIKDSAQNSNEKKRQVGSWNLKDDKGRPVPRGMYVIRGKVNSSGGKSERVSLILSVR